jgi:hypothetical protein
MRRFLLVLGVLGVLGGCATTEGMNPTESRSGFDGARVVKISRHGNACQAIACTGLGGQWSSARPDQVVLTVSVFNEIIGITGATVSVDGVVRTLVALPGLTNFSRFGDPIKESRQDFSVSVQLIRDIHAAKRAWLRVQTTDGYLEDAIIDGTTDSKAFHALGRLLAAIDQPSR